MSENLRKLIGVAVMAVIVVVGVVATSDDDSDFTRNAMLFQGINQADDGEIEALETRLARIERYLAQNPKMSIVAEVVDRAEAGSARVDRSVTEAIESIENAVEEVENAEEEGLRQIQETIDWLGLGLEHRHEREFSRSYFVALRNAAATINNQEEQFNSSLMALGADLNAWVENANAQMTGVAPLFGPEFPGIGPLVDILCRTQLASWGLTASYVQAGWNMYEEFWACAYSEIQPEELNHPDDLAFCLPGQEFFGQRREGQWGPELFESIGRVATSFSNYEDTLRFDGVCS